MENNQKYVMEEENVKKKEEEEKEREESKKEGEKEEENEVEQEEEEEQEEDEEEANDGNSFEIGTITDANETISKKRSEFTDGKAQITFSVLIHLFFLFAML
ncbi:hypothetical protein PoB_004189100 [Plakobranchus ocellatus]|uniref:Uncharacterized protein n=1 Tax=Plakobranchus ocellatus TaxID=259542 RepID=A0AAV4AWA5_9GAST|nr:hypothetical protein PoB_004189100 [Plakobranchus ocellatus]